MTDSLGRHVEIWWQAVDDVLGVLEAVPPGAPHDDVEIGEPAHVGGPMGVFTEQGIVARRGRTPDELVGELRTSATSRHTRLLEEPPTDPDAPAPGPFAAIGWSVGQLLRNRPLDIWLHEQDVRRAVGRPGNLDGPAAIHTTEQLADSLGFVLAKRVGAAPGTSLVVEVSGHAPVGFEVGDDGRGRRLAEPPAWPTVRLATDRESFTLLAAGRRTPGPEAVSVEGDRALGEQVVASMAVTP